MPSTLLPKTQAARRNAGKDGIRRSLDKPLAARLATGAVDNTDREGDVSMGATPGLRTDRFTPYAQKGRPKRSDTTSNGRRDQSSNKPVDIKISGHHGAPQSDLLDYLKRKVRGAILTNLRIDGTTLIASVPNSRVAKDVLAISGNSFAGNKLRIDATSDATMITNTPRNSSTTLPSAATTINTIDTLKRFISKRYDQASGMFDLSMIKEDEDMKQLGVSQDVFSVRGNKMFLALMKLSGEIGIKPVSINLAYNGLTDVNGITTLAHEFPDLLNLSLSNNQLTKWKDIDAWKPKHKFRILRELLLTDNPICRSEMDRLGEQAYRAEVVRRFPSLKMLDGKVVEAAPEFKFGIEADSKTTTLSLPVPIRHSYLQDDAVKETTTQFLLRYFHLFDTDRNNLVCVYAPNATFSYAVDISKGSRVRFSDDWIATSRNLKKLVRGDASMTRLSFDTAKLAQVFASLPRVRHELSNPDKLVVDASWINLGDGPPTGIMISVHGDLVEVKTNATRGFDRTFVIAPLSEQSGINVSAAAALGFNCCIISDILILRNTFGPLPITPQQTPLASQNGGPSQGVTTNIQPVPSTSIPSSTAAPTDLRQEMITKLKTDSGMNQQYTEMALEQNGWDINKALETVLSYKVQGLIPAEAFI